MVETKADPSLKILPKAAKGSVVVSGITLSTEDFTGTLDAEGFDKAELTVDYEVSYASGEEYGDHSVFAMVLDDEGNIVEDVIDWVANKEYEIDGEVKVSRYIDLSFTKDGNYTLRVVSNEDQTVHEDLAIEVTGTVPVTYRDYRKATSITPGKDYVIMAKGTSMAATCFVNYWCMTPENVSVKDDTFTTKDQKFVFKLVDEGDGTYSFLSRSNREYIYAYAEHSAAAISNGKADETKWRLNYDSVNSSWQIQSDANNKYMLFSGSLWRIYDSLDAGIAPELYEVDNENPHFAALEIAKQGKTNFVVDDCYEPEGLVLNAIYTGDTNPTTISGFTSLNTKGVGFSLAIGSKLTEGGNQEITLTYTINDETHSVSYSIYVEAIYAYTLTHYTKVTPENAPKDWRGTYLLVYEQGEDSVMFDASLSYEKIGKSGNSRAASIEDNGIDGNLDIDAKAIKIARVYTFDEDVYLSGHPYAAKVSNGNYLYGSPYYMGVSDYMDEECVASFFGAGDVLSIGGVALRYNPSTDRFKCVHDNPAYEEISLYKLDENEEIEDEVACFVGFFDEKTKDICKLDNSTDIDELTTVWSSAESVYKNSISYDAQGILANLTYTPNGEEIGSTEDIVNRYDFIVNKYGLEDFMDRGELIEANNAHALNAPLANNDNNVFMLMVFASIATVSTIGCLFLLRKRRQD